MDGSGTGYLKTVRDDVHLNPVRAKPLAVGGFGRFQIQSVATT